MFLLEYDRQTWMVNTVLAIHGLSITEEAIRARKPPSDSARRAGWQGFDIDLSKVLRSGRVPIVAFGKVMDPVEVQQQWRVAGAVVAEVDRLKGWAREIMLYIDQIGTRFSLSDIYAAAPMWSDKYPANENIEAKIRQQLQHVRDRGLLRFVGRGEYERTAASTECKSSYEVRTGREACHSVSGRTHIPGGIIQRTPQGASRRMSGHQSG